MLGTGLHVRNLTRSVDFYTEVLGAHEAGRYQLPELTEVSLSFGDGQAALMLIERSDHAGPYAIGDGLNKLMLEVDDVQRACAGFAAWGCEIEKPPTPLPEHGVTVAIAHDPDGHRLELLQLT
jgi:lactoylglutathione lyase